MRAFDAGFGARKMWLPLRGQGHDVARCTVERLMAEMGITGLVGLWFKSSRGAKELVSLG
jgi:transposase InsO family protein